VKAPQLQKIRTMLRDVGLRATHARVAVLARLLDARSLLSHGDLAGQLLDQGYDRATVYRNLLDLTDAGLARRNDIGDHVWRFELVRPAERHDSGAHPHFVCGECGIVSCLPEGAVSLKPRRGTPRALRKRGLSVQVRGLCDACG
jgi:Fur family ferric uptake transcriptional regulator